MDNIWWNKVTNASHFLSMIVGSIQDGQSVVLQLPKKVPWYMTMRDIVSTEVIRTNSTRSYKNINDNGDDPGEFLFYEFCKKEKRAHYRPGIGYPEFLAQSNDIPLNQHILWVSGSSNEQAKKWYSFIESYNMALGKNKSGCLFVIEANDVSALYEKRGIKLLKYESIIEYYDNYLFNMLASSEQKENTAFKQYLAEAVSLMIPDDVELASKCVIEGRKFLNAPVEILNNIVKEDYRSDGTDFNVTTTPKQLEERLWEAQIKVVFPLVEKHRNSIIAKYKASIELLLPIKTVYGEKFTDVSEVELGTIAYLVEVRKIDVNNEDYKKISILKNARNVLAHIKTLTQKQVDEIFSL